MCRLTDRETSEKSHQAHFLFMLKCSLFHVFTVFHFQRWCYGFGCCTWNESRHRHGTHCQRRCSQDSRRVHITTHWKGVCRHDYHREGGSFGKFLQFQFLWLTQPKRLRSIPGCFRSSQGPRTCPHWISRRCHRPRSCRRYWLHVRGLPRLETHGSNQCRLRFFIFTNEMNPNKTHTRKKKDTNTLPMKPPVLSSVTTHYLQIFLC